MVRGPPGLLSGLGAAGIALEPIQLAGPDGGKAA